jgi:predicted N-acetyltransferase YhbS
VYVEPVTTDPDYRRKGPGKAAVLESVHRYTALDANTAYVGNDLPIYLAIGFKVLYTTQCCLSS